MKRWLRIGAGFSLVFVGLLGWVLPILPGWVFVIPGLMLLGKEFHWARRILQWLRNRLPKRSVQD